MEDFDLTSMRAFRAIVETGSFTTAADRLGMAAPMVSKHMARLEKQLGARLLNRTSRRLSLTEAGTLLLEQGGRALDLLDDAAASINSASTEPRGELKVSAPGWCATPAFASLLADYQQACPAVRLDLHLENRLVDLAAESFDLALRVSFKPSPTLIARRLCDVAFYLVATPGYMHQRSADNLAIVAPNYLPFERLGLAKMADGVASQFDTVLRTSNSMLIHMAVLAGMGAARLPGWVVDADVATGRLVVLNADRSLRAGLFAVYSSRRYLPPKLRSFIDFLITQLSESH